MKLTKLSVPQLAILSKSRQREEIVSTLDENLFLKEGFLENIVQDCKVELSDISIHQQTKIKKNPSKV